MSRDDQPDIPQEDDSFLMWVLMRAGAESDGMPETQLLTQDGEQI